MKFKMTAFDIVSCIPELFSNENKFLHRFYFFSCTYDSNVLPIPVKFKYSQV